MRMFSGFLGGSGGTLRALSEPHPPVTGRVHAALPARIIGAAKKSYVLAALPLFGLVGCVAPAPLLPLEAQRYRIEARLEPETHRLMGRTVMDLVRVKGQAEDTRGPVSVALLLHPALRLTHVDAAGGVSVRVPRGPAPAVTQVSGTDVRRHVFVLDRPEEALTLFVDYEGELFQDVAAGEKPGEIHNFKMRAHIDTQGVYLAGGYWYPQPVATDDRTTTADFSLIVDPIPGVVFAASGESDAVLTAQTGRLAWRSPYPLQEMVLVGGPHEVHEAACGDIRLRAHLKPSQKEFAAGLLAAASRILERYQPLIGPYPAREFTIVDNFFSSGFAFPTFTLLSSAVIEMGERSQATHGYLDHELLHNWWGNGVLVDHRDGNWCESLASYAANYYGFVLDGNEAEARRKRRNHCHFLSRREEELAAPLGTYERDNGCGRGVAYLKGANVFHMLAREMGQERFWSAMRRFTAEYVGRPASWEDIRAVCEAECGRPLGAFFEQWVRRGGAPSLHIEGADFEAGRQTLTLSVQERQPHYDIAWPLRVQYAGGALDVDVTFSGGVAEVALPAGVVPESVALDPDYHVFRRVAPEEIVPTTASTRAGAGLVTVLPAGEVPEVFTSLREIFESSYKAEQRTSYTAGSIAEGALAERCVLVAGSAVHDPYVAGFLTAAEFPVRFQESGFEFADVTYAEPGEAILCTARHPGVPGGGITVLYGNSVEAVPRAGNVPFYEHSVVVFRNGRPVLRTDLERPRVVPVRRR